VRNCVLSAETGETEVDATTIDRLIERELIRTPDIVKIDVEGAEFRVLEGGARMFSWTKPIVFLATHGADAHNACCSRLPEWGYALQAVETKQSFEETDEIIATP
jgi:hypothetical protein